MITDFIYYLLFFFYLCIAHLYLGFWTFPPIGGLFCIIKFIVFSLLIFRYMNYVFFFNAILMIVLGPSE